MSERSSPQRIGGALTVAAIVLSLVSWRVAFNLGAFGAVLYEDLHSVLVASAVLFVVAVVNRPFGPGRNVLAAVVLAAPSAWFAAAVVVDGSTERALERPVFVLAAAAVIAVSIPVTLRLLIAALYPEISVAASRNLSLAVVAIAAVVASAGFLLGRHNDRIMTCADFEIAGAYRPDNCAEGT